MTARHRPRPEPCAPAAPEAWFLVGPTASGKSAAAHRLAVALNCDVLSADSMQVYRGLDVGTDKPSAAQRAEVRYYGLDLVPPEAAFSVHDYRRYAVDVLARGAAAGRRFIVAGGTGLYVKSLVRGLAVGPRPDPERRRYWQQRLASEGVASLRRALRERDAAACEALADGRNPRRLIRALERAEQGFRGRPDWPAPPGGGRPVALWVPPAELRHRIEKRVGAMYRRGLLEEVRALLDAGTAFSSTAGAAIGYAEAVAVLQGRLSREEAVARTVARTCRLAKRQRTWFRHQEAVVWVEAGQPAGMETVAARVREKWQRHGPTRIAP